MVVCVESNRGKPRSALEPIGIKDLVSRVRRSFPRKQTMELRCEA